MKLCGECGGDCVLDAFSERGKTRSFTKVVSIEDYIPSEMVMLITLVSFDLLGLTAIGLLLAIGRMDC